MMLPAFFGASEAISYPKESDLLLLTLTPPSWTRNLQHLNYSAPAATLAPGSISFFHPLHLLPTFKLFIIIFKVVGGNSPSQLKNDLKLHDRDLAHCLPLLGTAEPSTRRANPISAGTEGPQELASDWHELPQGQKTIPILTPLPL